MSSAQLSLTAGHQVVRGLRMLSVTSIWLVTYNRVTMFYFNNCVGKDFEKTAYL